MKKRSPSISASPSDILKQKIKLNNKYGWIFGKNSLCVTVIFINIYLQVNNKYSDTAIG